MSYQKLEGNPVPYIEVDVPVNTREVTEEASSQPKGTPRGLVKTCCGCFSLGTGVTIMGVLDILFALAGLGSCLIVLLAHSHEHAVDQAIINTANFNITATEIDRFNKGIDIAWHGTPLILLLSLVALFFGYQGILAGNQKDIVAARRFYIWKTAHFIAALFSLAPLHIILTLYFAIIARSYFFDLQTNILPLYHVGEPIAQVKTVATPTSSPLGRATTSI